jgi:hypothetical protein
MRAMTHRKGFACPWPAIFCVHLQDASGFLRVWSVARVPETRQSWTSALDRKRSYDACTRGVRHSALPGETTIRTKREGYGDLAGRRIAGGLRTSAQVSRARPSRRFYSQLTHSSYHGFLDPLDPLIISSRAHLPSTTLACSVHSWL